MTYNMIQIPIERSTQIAAVGYDADILIVRFRRGGMFAYDQVSPREYDALMHAESMGAYFAKHIKGVKPWKQLSDTPSNNVVEMKKSPASASSDKTADDLAAAAREWAARANALTISDVASHEIAQRALLSIAQTRERIVATWKPMKDAAFKAHRAVCDKEKELLAPLEAADKQLRTRIGAYTYQQLLLAQAEDERKRKIAEAEARERAQRETEEQALAAAEELAQMGDLEGAEAVLEAPPPVMPRYDQMPAPTKIEVASVDGVSGSIDYEITITDMNAIPREYCVFDKDKTITNLRRIVRQAGGRVQIAGVAIRETYTPRRTGARR
jgi:hypothetical protein